MILLDGRREDTLRNAALGVESGSDPQQDLVSAVDQSSRSSVAAEQQDSGRVTMTPRLVRMGTLEDVYDIPSSPSS